MEIIKIDNQQINEVNIDSAIFLQYLQSYGFDANEYYYILELFQSAKGSISQFLKPLYRQYLLSRQVDYDELDELEIDGAYGYFHENGIIIPKTIENDNRFLHSSAKRIYNKQGYECPTIYDFDVIIANGTSPYMNNIANTNYGQKKYLGFCMNAVDDNLDISLEMYKHLLDLINKTSRDQYVLEHDRLSLTSGAKELCLIRKK